MIKIYKIISTEITFFKLSFTCQINTNKSQNEPTKKGMMSRGEQTTSKVSGWPKMESYSKRSGSKRSKENIKSEHQAGKHVIRSLKSVVGSTAKRPLDCEFFRERKFVSPFHENSSVVSSCASEAVNRRLCGTMERFGKERMTRNECLPESENSSLQNLTKNLSRICDSENIRGKNNFRSFENCCACTPCKALAKRQGQRPLVSRRLSPSCSSCCLRQNREMERRGVCVCHDDTNDCVAALSAFRNSCAHILLVFSFLVSLICKFFIETIQTAVLIATACNQQETRRRKKERSTKNDKQSSKERKPAVKTENQSVQTLDLKASVEPMAVSTLTQKVESDEEASEKPSEETSEKPSEEASEKDTEEADEKTDEEEDEGDNEEGDEEGDEGADDGDNEKADDGENEDADEVADEKASDNLSSQTLQSDIRAINFPTESEPKPLEEIEEQEFHRSKSSLQQNEEGYNTSALGLSTVLPPLSNPSVYRQKQSSNSFQNNRMTSNSIHQSISDYKKTTGLARRQEAVKDQVAEQNETLLERSFVNGRKKLSLRVNQQLEGNVEQAGRVAGDAAEMGPVGDESNKDKQFKDNEKTWVRAITNSSRKSAMKRSSRSYVLNQEVRVKSWHKGKSGEEYFLGHSKILQVKSTEKADGEKVFPKDPKNNTSRIMNNNTGVLGKVETLEPGKRNAVVKLEKDADNLKVCLKKKSSLSSQSESQKSCVSTSGRSRKQTVTFDKEVIASEELKEKLNKKSQRKEGMCSCKETSANTGTEVKRADKMRKWKMKKAGVSLVNVK